jgi:Uma2 family endonuclease
MNTSSLSSAEFAECLADDDLGTQWSELIAGQIVQLEPPDLVHGAVVLNITKAVAVYLQSAPDEMGYACFQIGLVVARNPDTVRRPPVSIFVGGERFAEIERRVTDTRPRLIIEIASSNDRRRTMAERVQSYLDWGVQAVWVADTAENAVHVIQKGQPQRVFRSEQSVPGTPAFADFHVRASELFELPKI